MEQVPCRLEDVKNDLKHIDIPSNIAPQTVRPYKPRI